MPREMKKKGIASFQGLTIGKNGTVQLKFKFKYDEMLTSVELLQGLNNDITVYAKLPNRNPMELGVFTIGSINFDRDGNAMMPLKSMTDNVNLANICSLADEEVVQLRFRALLNLPEPEEEQTEERDEEIEGEAEEWED